MTFREFFRKKHGFDFPGHTTEETHVVQTRALNTMADFMDELAGDVRRSGARRRPADSIPQWRVNQLRWG